MTPAAIVLDVNETLSDISGLGARLTDVGLPADLARDRFTAVLRDGFALTAVGGTADFDRIATEELGRRLERVCPSARARSAARHVTDGSKDLPIHPDVPEGIRHLRDHGFRLLTMTNGSVSSTDHLLRRAGLREHFELLLDSRQPTGPGVETGPYRVPVRAARSPAVGGTGPAGRGTPAGRRRSTPGRPRRRVDPPVRARLPLVQSPPTLIADDLVDLAVRLARAH
ncbi:HAD family hydrolase [Streptomyces cinereoruber]|uniref:HAD family hydrolase n=1 Tax=Streptomyces cinereoruber TaxID=67260 RepID=UPI003637F35F